MIFEKFENLTYGSFATRVGPVHVQVGDALVATISDTEGDMVSFNQAECAELWPALKAFAETGDIRNADYGPRVPPLAVKEFEGGGGYGANFLSEGETPCHAGISQEKNSEFVNLRTSASLGAEITLDRDTAERLALVLLRFAKTGRIEEQTKDVGETIDPTANCE